MGIDQVARSACSLATMWTRSGTKWVSIAKAAQKTPSDAATGRPTSFMAASSLHRVRPDTLMRLRFSTFCSRAQSRRCAAELGHIAMEKRRCDVISASAGGIPSRALSI